MKISSNCLPCIMNQTIKLANKLTDNQALRTDIIRYGLKQIADEWEHQATPEIVSAIYSYAKEATGITDPYEVEKKESNENALKLISQLNLRELISESSDSFDIAVRLSLAGNIIDFGAGYEVSKEVLEDSVQTSIKANIFGDSIETLKKELKTASRVLFLSDNAGEIVFDKLLIEGLENDQIIYAVKSGAIVNDATLVDTNFVKMDQLSKVITNGTSMQGTVLDECSSDFLEEFNKADIIISKGMANYETLSDVYGRNIFFLLRAKCDVVADSIGCEKWDFVIKNNK